ncbi:MAG: hypothetical protein IJ532_08990 [Alphaproteobacteria bacterium]|nr:hypothetical protein [Alphaproteobacteria bacterium]
MRKFIYIAAAVVFLAITGSFFNVRAGELIYYENGQSERLSDDNISEITKIIDELVSGVDDALKLIVMDDTIDELKRKKCLEIILSDKREVQPNEFIQQGFAYYKLLLPIYEGERVTSAILYFGNEKVYYTPPYVNKDGRKYIDEIRKIIGK